MKINSNALNKLVPDARPSIKLDAVLKIFESAKVTDEVKLLGIRGFFQKPGSNQRGIYDDAIILVSPSVFLACNANCDPSAFRKNIANLKEGLWSYKVGIHGLSKPKELQYTALVQAAKVTVVRDQVGDDTGFFGINIHRGGLNSTSSLGCQTIVPSEWSSFITTVQAQLKKAGQKTIPYLLIKSSGLV